MRWQGKKGGRVVRWQGGRVVRWRIPDFVQGWGMHAG